MTLETQGADRGVTPDGMQRLMRFIAAVRPHQPIDPDVIAAWTHKLNEHGINDRDALTAANRLADNDDGRDIPVGAVVHAARNIRNRRYLDERPTTPELPRGESRWDRLSDDERAPYIDQALEAWHGFATRRDSPPVVGLARHYARQGNR